MSHKNDREEKAMNDALIKLYLTAKTIVIAAGFEHEIEWQKNVSFEETTEATFIGEAAWVVLNSGFRGAIARKLWDGGLRAAFEDFPSAEYVVQHQDRIFQAARKVFKGERKLDAMVKICRIVRERGWEDVKKSIRERGVIALQEFPFMGPITSYHLAKNIGLDVVKPDRHLVRMAEAFGFSSPHELCAHVKERLGVKVAVVDMVLWRYATLKPNYLSEILEQVDE
jgi:hypothetical protein